MIIYNVTVKVENSIQNEWLKWMEEKHIPAVMATGCFTKNKIMRLLEPPADEQGTTYAVQYFCKDMETLQHYSKQHAPALQADHMERYKGKYVAFRTVMEVV
ncbi:MAG TPA: DUF4286 family protein [Bacteroidetes bacterium]|nr:DUF4286 family protein [Bacteroidota bacterium]